MIQVKLTDFEFADILLEAADEYGLTAEVVVFALKTMKENPALSIEEALLAGYSDWIK